MGITKCAIIKLCHQEFIKEQRNIIINFVKIVILKNTLNLLNINMSNRVSINNPNIRKYEYTELTADISAGSDVACSVKNNQGFSADDLVLVRKPGREKSEVCTVGSTTENTTITLSTVTLDHSKGTEIRKIPYDQVALFSASSEDGSYSIVGAYVSIEYDDVATYIDDSDGDTSTWYKAKFKNSESGVTTDYSDAFQITDAGFYCTIGEILEEAGLEDNRYLDMNYVYRTRKRAQQEVDGKLYDVYELPFSTTPDTIKEITRLLAAGWLLYKEYGSEADGTSKDGMTKVKEARSWLKQIVNGDIVLRDSDGDALTRRGKSHSDLEGWPDNTTADADDDDAGGDIHFRIGDEF